MKFVQVIEYTTDHEAEVEALEEQWKAETEGKRTTGRSLFARDRAQPNRYIAVVEFPSYEEARRNNDLPATQEFARKMSELCDGPVRFTDGDVLSVEET